MKLLNTTRLTPAIALAGLLSLPQAALADRLFSGILMGDTNCETCSNERQQLSSSTDCDSRSIRTKREKAEKPRRLPFELFHLSHPRSTGPQLR